MSPAVAAQRNMRTRAGGKEGSPGTINQLAKSALATQRDITPHRQAVTYSPILLSLIRTILDFCGPCVALLVRATLLGLRVSLEAHDG